MTGLDPCNLGPSQDVLKQFVLPNTAKRLPVDPDTPAIAECEWDNFPNRPDTSVTVSVVPDQDTAGFLRFPEAVVTSVAGFPAIEGVYGMLSGPAEDGCLLRVDVAKGQGIWVDFTTPNGDRRSTHEQMCQYAHTVAESVMQTLLARAK